MILSTQQILNRNNDLLKEKNSTSLKIDGDKVISNEFNRSGFIAWAQIATKPNAALKSRWLKINLEQSSSPCSFYLNFKHWELWGKFWILSVDGALTKSSPAELAEGAKALVVQYKKPAEEAEVK